MMRPASNAAPSGLNAESPAADLVCAHKIGDGEIVTQDQRGNGRFACAVGAVDDDGVGLEHVIRLSFSFGGRCYVFPPYGPSSVPDVVTEAHPDNRIDTAEMTPARMVAPPANMGSRYK